MIIFSIQSLELVRAMKIREKASRAGLAKDMGQTGLCLGYCPMWED